MKSGKKNTIKDMIGILVILLAGMLVSVGITAALVGGDVITEPNGRWIALLVTEGMMFAVCWLQATRLPKRRLAAMAILAAAYAVFRLLIKLVLFPSMEIRWSGIIWTLLVAVLAGLLAEVKKPRRRRR